MQFSSWAAVLCTSTEGQAIEFLLIQNVLFTSVNLLHIIVIIIIIMFSYHWFSFPWYFSSWTNGEPHHSGFKPRLLFRHYF
jgi:hypothetical protein